MVANGNFYKRNQTNTLHIFSLPHSLPLFLNYFIGKQKQNMSDLKRKSWQLKNFPYYLVNERLRSWPRPKLLFLIQSYGKIHSPDPDPRKKYSIWPDSTTWNSLLILFFRYKRLWHWGILLTFLSNWKKSAILAWVLFIIRSDLYKVWIRIQTKPKVSDPEP